MPGGSSAGEGGATNDFPFGIDPSEDPELAMAIRASIEDEERRRQTTTGGTTEVAKDTEMKETPSSGVDEEDELLRAIAMSMQSLPQNTSTTPTTVVPPDNGDDDEVKKALEMSLMDISKDDVPKTETTFSTDSPKVEPKTETSPKTETTTIPDLSSVMDNPNLVHDILRSLPGIDFEDPAIKGILESVGQQSRDPKSEEEEIELAMKMSLDAKKDEDKKDDENKQGDK